MFQKNFSVATVILSCLCAVPTSSWAQSNTPTSNPTLNDITPPAPNAASLGKFGDVPVGYATGIPQISVPIYSYSNADNSLSMSISLDYHAGGIRVDEVESNVGVGFALNAGGVVSRTHRGIADEIRQYGFREQRVPLSQLEGNIYGQGIGLISGQSYFIDVANNNVDGQTDIFNFSFNGRNGKFMFGKNNDFLMLSMDPVDVQTEMGTYGEMGVTGENFKRFKIKDEKGVTYIFDAPEVTTTDYHTTPWPNFVSSWYLTRVIAPFSTDTIKLEYEAESYQMYTAVSNSTTIGLNGLPNTFSQSSRPGVSVTGKRIKKITFPNQVTVVFNYDTTTRPGFVSGGMYRLKDIAISDGTHTRGYNLYHDYSMNRLTLLKVLPYTYVGGVPNSNNSNLVEDKGYIFDYYKGDGHLGSILPDRFSTHQDHWGFYNSNYIDGRDGDVIPTEYINMGDYKKLPGGNRDVDTARVQCGSITKVTYPTGGYTTYKMEANMADDARLRQHIVLKNQDVPISRSLPVYCTSDQPIEKSFEFNGEPLSTTRFSISFIPNDYVCGNENYCKIIAEIRNAAGVPITEPHYISLTRELTVEYEFGLNDLMPGATYTLHLQTDGVSNLWSYGTMTWPEKVNVPDSTILDVYKPYVGGLRVKRIANYDGVNTAPVSVREFDYVEEDGITTSGGLGAYPVYTHWMYYDFHDECYPWPPDGENIYLGNFPGLVNALVRSSNSTQMLPSISGSPVNYSRVVERQTDRGSFNGSTIRYYTSFKHARPSYQLTLPFVPPKDSTFAYGQLDLEVILNAQQDTIRVTRNEYEVVSTFHDSTALERHNNFRSIALMPAKYSIRYINCDDDLSNDFRISDFWVKARFPNYYLSKTYLPLSGRKDLKKTITIDYADGLKHVNEVAYTRDTYFNIKTATTSTSKGHQVTQRLYYPQEYSSNSVAQAMVNTHNMVATPISAETWKTINAQQYLTGGFASHYTSVASGIRPTSADVFESAVPVPASQVPAFKPASFNRAPALFIPALIFSQYNSKGFIAEQAKVNDVTQAILWDYNQQLPVAEVNNALLSQIAFTSFETSYQGEWIVTSNARDNGNARTGGRCYNLDNGNIKRTNLPVSQTYILSYWSMNGAYSITGATQTSPVTGKTVNGWTFYEHTITTTLPTVTLSGSGRIDELRLYPFGAQMKTYTYDLLYGVSSMTDANSSIAYYEYDGFGRLIYIKDDEGNVLKKLEYKYREQ